MKSYFGSESLLFTLLSLTISVMSSYSMFLLIGNLKRSGGEGRCCLLGGAAVYGLGISVMHFLMILVSDTMVIIDWTTFWLLVILTGCIYGSLVIFRSGIFRVLRLCFSSTLLAISSTGFLTASMLSGPVVRYQLREEMLAAAFGISLAGAFCSFFWYERGKGNWNFLSSLLLGSAAMGMELVVLRGIVVQFSGILTAERMNESLKLLASLLGVGTLIVIGFSLTTWAANKRLGQIGEQYKLLVENSIDMIAIFSQGEWKYVNRSGMKMFEADRPEQLIGKSVYAFLHPKHHKESRLRHIAMIPETTNGPIELEWFTVKGRLFHTEVVETMTSLTGMPAVQIIIRDITERKKNEELLINSEKLYVAGQLAAGIAHEIRNPLTSLKGFLQLITSGRDATKHYYDIMKSELNRIESIVSELLMLSKPQIYELSYRDARKIMEDTVILLEPQAILHDIELEASYDESPLWIYGVENQIKQVFINVLKNAIEVMPEGGKIKIGCIKTEHEVMIRIEDQGPGISEEQLTRIGQPFYTTKVKGTGLGLMVSYKIVDNHQGRIQAYSQVGVGTTFEIVLPYAEPAQ
ncbi:ATP-binding protein [Paenibacillus tarimensis]